MRTSQLVVVPLFVFGALAACGGATAGGSAGSSNSGKVAGTGFTVASEFAALGFANTDTQCNGTTCFSTHTGKSVVVLASNRAEFTCAVFQRIVDSIDGPTYANFEFLELGVVNETGDVTVGTYPVVAMGSGKSGAYAQFATETSTCGPGLDLWATSGTVTLTQLSAAQVAGSYNLVFATEGTFSGSFDVPICVLPDAGAPLQDAGPPVCQP
jgi:hypothetical protein